MTTLNKPKFKGTHRGTNTVASLDPLLGSVGLLLSSSATISHVRFLALKLARGFFACTHCNPCSTLLVVLDRPPSWLAPDCGVARAADPSFCRLTRLVGRGLVGAVVVAPEFVVGEVPTETLAVTSGLTHYPGYRREQRGGCWVRTGPLLTPRWGRVAIYNRSPLAGLGQKLPSGHGLCTHRGGAHRTRRTTGTHVSPH